MYKRLAYASLAILLVIAASVSLFYCWQQITERQNASPEYLDYFQKDVYLSLPGGSLSRIYLVNSTASFGTFAHFFFGTDPFDLFDYGAMIGEQYVYISGTVRNDDNRTLWIPFLADLTTSKGEKIGSMVRTNGHTEFVASYVGVEPGETGDFSITIKYGIGSDRKAISDYNIYLAWVPMEYPPT